MPGRRSPEVGGAPLPGPRSPEVGGAEEEGAPLPGPRSPEAGGAEEEEEGVPLPGPRSRGSALQNGLRMIFLHLCLFHHSWIRPLLHQIREGEGEGGY